MNETLLYEGEYINGIKNGNGKEYFRVEILDNINKIKLFYFK